MDESTIRELLARLVVRLVSEAVASAEDAIRLHSVPESQGVGDSFPLGDKQCRLSSQAPPEMASLARTLQAVASWKVAIETEDLLLVSTASLAMGGCLYEARTATALNRDFSQLVTATQNSRKGNSLGGSRGKKWNEGCERIAREVWEQLMCQSNLSETGVFRRIAAKIQQELGIEIGFQRVKANITRLIQDGKAKPRPPKRARK